MNGSLVTKTKIRFYRMIHKIGLKNRDFTIVSNNCWGGFVYQEFNMRYNSPFIGLYIYASDYIKLLENFKEYMQKELVFIEPSKSIYCNELKKNNTLNKYPVALLDDIEIHFLHYKSQEEAMIKWTKRKMRINYNNILYKFSDNDLCSEELIKKFSELRYENKICFTAKKYNYNSVIQLKEFEGEECISNEWSISKKYVNIKKLLNDMIY